MSRERGQFKIIEDAGAGRGKIEKESAREIPSSLSGGAIRSKSMRVDGGDKPRSSRKGKDAWERTQGLSKGASGKLGRLVTSKKHGDTVTMNGFARAASEAANEGVRKITGRRRRGGGERVSKMTGRVSKKRVERSIKNVGVPRHCGGGRSRNDGKTVQVWRRGDEGNMENSGRRLLVKVKSGKRDGVIRVKGVRGSG